MPDNERLLSLGEAADLLHVSDATVRRAIRAGKLPALLVGGRYRVRPRALTEYLDGMTVAPLPH